MDNQRTDSIAISAAVSVEGAAPLVFDSQYTLHNNIILITHLKAWQYSFIVCVFCSYVLCEVGTCSFNSMYVIIC